MRICNQLHAFPKTQDMLGSSLSLMGYVAAVSGLVYLLSYWLVPLMAARTAHKIRMHFFKAVLRQDMDFMDARSPGELTMMLNENIAAIQVGLSKKLIELFMSSFSGVRTQAPVQAGAHARTHTQTHT